MSDQVNIAFTQKWFADYILLSQQKMSRLENAVRRDADSLNGKFGHFNRIGATAMVKRTTRHADTPIVNTPHSRRRVTLEFFEWADLIDKADAQKVIANPQSTYLQNAVAAANRQKDDTIIAAMNGNAYSLDADEASTAVALPSAQKIAVASAGLTLAKLLTTKEILDGAEVDEDEPKFCAVSAKQVTNLLNTTEIKSADYNTVKALSEGKIDTFLGFKFIRTQRLTNSSTTRYCLAWAQSGVGMAKAQDITAQVTERPDKSYSTQVYVSEHIGATRIEDVKVVQIACLES